MILFQFIFDIETGSYNSLGFIMRSSLPHHAPPLPQPANYAWRWELLGLQYLEMGMAGNLAKWKLH